MYVDSIVYVPVVADKLHSLAEAAAARRCGR